MEALFTSLDGGDALRQRILRLIEDSSTLAASHDVALHVMAFAFTDSSIAGALVSAANRHPGLTILLLADWSQRILDRGQQAGCLAALQLPNLLVRYTRDQPYVWDAAAGHMRWSYHASRGLLHHKTLSLLVGGCPRQLVCGSFNWTATAARSYEQLLVLSHEQEPELAMMVRMEEEFRALWCDGRISLAPHEAQQHYDAIREEYRLDLTQAPAAIPGLDHGAGATWPVASETIKPAAHAGLCRTAPEFAAASIAFTWRGLEPGKAVGGAAEHNRSQKMILRSPAGRARLVPLTITNLALAAIYRAVIGDTLLLAMYGLSPRVPEYAALLDAARRGVRVFIILDRVVGSAVAARLCAVAQEEGLALEVRTAGRMMHQKYLVHRETATVVTGTANMSTDASCRHAEHRILVRADQELAARFTADFEEIWLRLKGAAVAGAKAERTPKCPRSNNEIFLN